MLVIKKGSDRTSDLIVVILYIYKTTYLNSLTVFVVEKRIEEGIVATTTSDEIFETAKVEVMPIRKTIRVAKGELVGVTEKIKKVS